MKDYHINIFYSEEDEAYIADIPEYVSAIAETPQQALNEVILAKTAWLEAAKAENKTTPKSKRAAQCAALCLSVLP